MQRLFLQAGIVLFASLAVAACGGGGGPRRDRTRSFRLNVHNRAFTVGGFSPQVSLVQEARASNAQLHDYERVSGELRFVRLF